MPDTSSASMDLHDFVRETLIQICRGIKDAQVPIREMGGYANPLSHGPVGDGSIRSGTVTSGHHTYLVDFDVAITVQSSSGHDGGAKVQVATFLSLGASGSADQSHGRSSRVTFKVPVAFPVDTASKVVQDREEHESAREFARDSGYNRREI